MRDDLAAELGAEVPPGVLALPADEQRRLVELIRAAKRRQRAELDAAFDATVKHVPFPDAAAREEDAAGMSAGTAAELAQLAHQLGVPGTDLDFLEAVDVADLRALRASIGEALFQADRHHFARMAALARAVPVQLAAKITVLALPPLLAARTAELFEPAKAVEMVTRLPIGYLTDVSAVMDPGRSPQVVAAMPAVTVAPVGRALAERGEWVVMGAFVSYVSPEALAATVADLTGAQLLRIGFVLDDGDRIGEITDALSDVQLDDLLAAAVDDELWEELDDLLGRIEGERAERLAGRFAVAPDGVRTAIDAAELSHRAVLG